MRNYTIHPAGDDLIELPPGVALTLPPGAWITESETVDGARRTVVLLKGTKRLTARLDTGKPVIWVSPED